MTIDSTLELPDDDELEELFDLEPPPLPPLFADMPLNAAEFSFLECWLLLISGLSCDLQLSDKGALPLLPLVAPGK